MRAGPLPEADQIKAVKTVLRGMFRDDLRGLYLHGSGVWGGLRPQSDLDLLAVIDGGMSGPQRDRLLDALLRLSGRHPAVPGRARCIDLMVCRAADMTEVGYPPRAEFIYGEWLRDGFERGERPMPVQAADITLVLAQAREQAVAVTGPLVTEVLPEIPADHVRRAMREAVPELLDGLRGDERNVLLTLARIWRTGVSGQFVTKNEAAAWAIPRLSAVHAATIDHARRAYLGEVAEDWENRGDDVRRLAEHLAERAVESL